MLWSCNLTGQVFAVDCDDLGKPYAPRIVYLDVENSHLAPKLEGFSIGFAVENAIRDIPFTGRAISRFVQENARTGRIKYSFADMKDDGSHYLLRIVANGGGSIRGPFKTESGRFIKDFEFTKYVDFSIYIINMATTKVERVVNVYAESYPFLKDAQEEKKKHPTIDLHSYALYASMRKEARIALESFFFNIHEIEVKTESENKVEGVITKFKGPNFKKIYKGAMDIVVVKQEIETPNGKLRIFEKIGTAKPQGMNKEKMIYYYIYIGKKALKKALDEGQKAYLVVDATYLL